MNRFSFFCIAYCTDSYWLMTLRTTVLIWRSPYTLIYFKSVKKMCCSKNSEIANCLYARNYVSVFCWLVEKCVLCSILQWTSLQSFYLHVHRWFIVPSYSLCCGKICMNLFWCWCCRKSCCIEESPSWKWGRRLSDHCCSRDQNSWSAESPKHRETDWDCDW